MNYLSVIILALSICVTPSLSTASQKLMPDEMPEFCPVSKVPFTYKGHTNSNQVTWESLPVTNRESLEDTWGPNPLAKQERATASVELLLLVRHSLKGNRIPADMTHKEILAHGEMAKLLNVVVENRKVRGGLLKAYLDSGRLPIDVLGDVLEEAKRDMEELRPTTGACALKE